MQRKINPGKLGNKAPSLICAVNSKISKPKGPQNSKAIIFRTYSAQDSFVKFGYFDGATVLVCKQKQHAYDLKAPCFLEV